MDPEPLFLPGKQIGDYLLDDRIAKGTNTSTWLAVQVSVQREVILCVLDPEACNDPELREGFIADVRAKAAVDHPLIASVLEAVNDGPMCYFAEEKLKGKHLGSLHEDGASIAPIHAARIIHNISGACNHLETHNTACVPLSPHDLFVDDKYHCRIVNNAVSGKINYAAATRDKEMVGHLIQDMIEPNQPGATRTNALLGYMADLESSQPLTWYKIHDLAGEIERQLARPGEHGQIRSSTMRLDTKSLRYLYLTGGLAKLITLLVLLLIAAGLAYHYTKRETPPEKRELADMVHIPAGKYPGPNGDLIKIKGFWIDVHEVTIAEYAEFLEVLKELSDDMKTVYQHDDQPAEKNSYEPDDWENLYTAAKNGGVWRQRRVDLNYPVVGVDWWDAYAYARWRDRQLPTHEEWYAACSAGSDPAKLPVTGWKPVDQTDTTSHGLHGMAGNVSEWMRKKTLNPADPSLPPRYMISGASYLRPKFGARAREWVDSRSLRRPDLGFRTYSSTGQQD